LRNNFFLLIYYKTGNYCYAAPINVKIGWRDRTSTRSDGVGGLATAGNWMVYVKAKNS